MAPAGWSIAWPRREPEQAVGVNKRSSGAVHMQGPLCCAVLLRSDARKYTTV